MFKLLVLSALCAVALSAPQYGHGGYEKHEEDYYTEPHYAFEYSVNDPHTYDIHSAKEERKGDSTHGEYSIVEPDGSKRTVQYHIEGKSGFIAEVQKGEGGYAKPSYYKSEPSYAKPSYYEKPSYKAEYEPSYKPSYSYSAAPAYKPAPSYYKPAAPAYKPAYYAPAPAYKPSYYDPAPAYKPAASYSYEPSYKPSYTPSYTPSYKPSSYDGHGHATSSVSIATHGAKILTSTKHVVPAPKHY